MVRSKPDPAASHGGNSWRPLGPLFPIQKGGQQLVCPLLGVSRGRAIIVPRGVLEDLLSALCHLQSYIDLDLCLCAFIEHVWEEGDPKSWR